MPTHHLKKMKQSVENRPGARAQVARTRAVRVLLAFLALAAIGIGMMLGGLWIPGSAFLPS
ncbi:hypothetical protein LAZ40_07055 [Cereibacter sphaeroides]|uniref:hypothetical protein n=1 Tax=Cereibacter sphaeroides TaxID=1063 RepID=UPI001F25F3D5|nr:hypothetical protein [Cereibacter sphaeroides]MCE6958806.1 hypothetical protein [Cereibacter sphaeroides]MCE6973320.1 hypothetical protein [Cereibacter sphaeroides]